MQTYIVLIRGINVGGKNRLPMHELKTALSAAGYANVRTYIASGNVLLDTDKTPSAVKTEIEKLLPLEFVLDDALIKVLVLSAAELQAVVSSKPVGFGDAPTTYHSDVIFLIDCSVDAALEVFNPREGVDRIWPGPNVIYSQRLSAQRSKSRLGVIAASPVYKSMTIRNWNTVTKLVALLEN